MSDAKPFRLTAGQRVSFNVITLVSVVMALGAVGVALTPLAAAMRDGAAFLALAADAAIRLLPVAAYLFALASLWRLVRRLIPGVTYAYMVTGKHDPEAPADQVLAKPLAPVVSQLGYSLAIGGTLSAVAAPWLSTLLLGAPAPESPFRLEAPDALVLIAVGLIVIQLAGALRNAEAAKAELEEFL